jgi:hypothetical protein
MAVRETRTVQPVPGTAGRHKVESTPSRIGHITLEAKQAGKRSAGNRPAPFDVAGTGDGFTDRLVRHSQKKWRETDRSALRNTAPDLDPP